jgi:hypothetical protein
MGLWLGSSNSAIDALPYQPDPSAMSDLILYTTEDGQSQIKLRAKDQTVWLSQREMSQLFDVSTDNVGLYLKNIFDDGELEANPVAEEFSVTAADGKNYLTKLYNLDAISHEQMENQTSALYLDYDQRRKTQEAQAADQENEADLKALEAKIKRRPKK